MESQSMKAINPLDYPICFAQPARIDNISAWIEHIPFGMFMVDILRPKILVELGTHTGVSYSAFCQAVKQLELNTQCFAVDTWEGDPHSSHYDAHVLANLRAYHDPLYGDFSRLIQSTFGEAVKYFADGSIDLLHIDGYHVYEAVKLDFETWFPKLSKSAVVLFHDTNVRERNFGVWKLWAELKQIYPSFEFFHEHGLGVLRVGREPTPALEALFSMPDDRATHFREFFFALGSRLSTQRTAKVAAAQVSGKDQLAQTFTTEINHKEQAIQALRYEVGQKEDLVQKLVARIAEHTQEMQALQGWAAETRQELSRIKSSKTWRIVSFFGNTLVVLVPPNSTRARLLQPVVHLVSFPLRRIERNRKLKNEAERIKKESDLIRSSGLFNEALYLAKNPDVAATKMDPAIHYLCFGGFEGRDPGPSFHSKWYLDAYEDVRLAGINPLVHYLKYGQAEGREKAYEEGRDVNFFALSKMHDYSKKVNCLVFEDSREKIFLQRPRVIGSFTGTLEEGETECPPAYVSVIEDATVFGGSSLVLVKPRNALSDEMIDYPGKEFGVKPSVVKFRRDTQVMLEYRTDTDLYIKEGILLSSDHDSNYFHWLVECLPKLVLIDELPQFKETPLLIPKGLHKNLAAALDRVNINNHPLILLEPDLAYHVERLIFPSALSRIIDRYQGHPDFDSDIVLSHKWVSKVGELLRRDLQSTQKPWRKLFLTRQKGLRALGNREELELRLLEQGFQIVELDGLSLEFQIRLFSQAAIIVAPTGAALTNMLFCQPGTKVIILMSNHEVTNYYFWPNLGAINKLDVTIIACQRLFKITDYWSVHDDYAVDIDVVLDAIHLPGEN